MLYQFWNGITTDFSIYYKSGTPNTDGTITASASYYVNRVNGGSDQCSANPVVTVDSNGYPWIATISDNGLDRYTNIFKSSTNDGTWVTASGFPKQSSSYPDANDKQILLPLPDGTVYDIIAPSSSGAIGKIYNSVGTVIATETFTSNTISGAACAISAVIDSSGNIFFAYDTGSNILWRERIYASSTFTPETSVVTGVGVVYPSISILKDKLVVFWVSNNKIWYNEYKNGNWISNSPVLLTDQSTDTIPNGYSIVSSYNNATTSYLAVFFQTLTSGAGNTMLKFIEYNYYKFTVTGSAGILDMEAGNWVFEGDRFYTFWANYTIDDSSLSSLPSQTKLAFSDGKNWVNASAKFASSTSALWSLDSGGNVSQIENGAVSYIGSTYLVTYPIILTSKILDAENVSIYLWVNDTVGGWSGWNLGASNLFNIYNLGGLNYINPSTGNFIRTISLNASDSYVKSDSPTGNYGSEIYVAVGMYGDASDIINRALFNFDLSTLDQNYQIDSANFSIYYYKYDGEDPFGSSHHWDLTVNEEWWAEYGVTWNLKPIITTDYERKDMPASFGWVKWDVTTWTRDFVNFGWGHYGFCLKIDTEPSSPNCTIYAYSKEYGNYVAKLDVKYEVMQVANRITGGSIFDVRVYANSTVAIYQYWKNLKSVDMVDYHWIPQSSMWNLGDNPLYSQHESQTWGIDYYYQGGWVHGLSVKIITPIYESLLTPNAAGGKASVASEVDWYYKGILIKQDFIRSFPFTNATTGQEPVSTTFYVDLWFDMGNASSVMGGRVQAEYYAIQNTNGWLATAISGQKFEPDMFNPPGSTCFVSLKDDSNKIFSSQNLKLFKLWENVTVGKQAWNPTFVYYKIQIPQMQVNDRAMSGVNNPATAETSMPNEPPGGGSFFSWVGGSLAAVGTVIVKALITGLQSLVNAFIGMLDYLFTRAGWANGFSILLGWISQFLGWMISAITYVALMLYSFFLFLATWLPTVLTTFASLVLGFISIFGFLITLWTGFGSTATGAGGFIIGLLQFLPLVVFIWLFMSKDFSQVLDKIHTLWDLSTSLVHILIYIGDFGINLISRVIQMFKGWI